MTWRIRIGSLNHESNRHIPVLSNSKCGRYVVKTLTAREQRALHSQLDEYAAYVHDQPNTLLARVYGSHQLRLYGYEVWARRVSSGVTRCHQVSSGLRIRGVGAAGWSTDTRCGRGGVGREDHRIRRGAERSSSRDTTRKDRMVATRRGKIV